MTARIGMNQLAALEEASNGRVTAENLAWELPRNDTPDCGIGLAERTIKSLVKRGLLTSDGKLTPAGLAAMNAKHQKLQAEGH